MTNCIKNDKNGVVYYTFPSLEKAGIVHGFSTRMGGVSKEHLASMNLSFSRGDNPDFVQENHSRFAKSVGYNKESLVFTDQVHDTIVQEVTKADCGKGILRESDLKGIDGLITSDPEVTLIAFFADCVPLYFYDKKNHAIGLSHSGWRGTVARMGEKTIQAMKKAFGTEPEDVVAVIGPSICQNCYEVSEDVAQSFVDEFGLKRKGELLVEKANGKYQLDLWRANEFVLLDAGMTPSQIEVSGMCTCCHPDVLFSHRASQGMRGNLAAVMTLGGCGE